MRNNAHSASPNTPSHSACIPTLLSQRVHQSLQHAFDRRLPRVELQLDAIIAHLEHLNAFQPCGKANADDLAREVTPFEGRNAVVENHLAVVDDDDALAQAFNVARVMAGEEDRRAFAFVQQLDRVANLLLGYHTPARWSARPKR